MLESPRLSLLAESLRAHALMFEAPQRPRYDGAAGLRMLAAFVLVAVGAFFALRLVLQPVTPLLKLAFVSVLLLAFFVVHRWFVRVPFAAIGMRPVGHWTRRERLYFVQVGILASIAFAFVFRSHFAELWAQGPADFAVIVATGLLWGAVQEFLYRGWLQTELVRRSGVIAGVLVANLVFTFGPLHMNWLAGPSVNWGMLGAIFAIGLVFGVIYHRSGNLWIPAVLHGLWPLNMT